MTSACAWLQKDDSPLKDSKYLHPWHYSGPEGSAPLQGGFWSPLCFHWSQARSSQPGSLLVTSASTTDGSSRNYRTMPATDTPEGNSSLLACDEKATPSAPTIAQLASPTLQGKSGPDWDAVAEPGREVCTMPTPLCWAWATIINHSLS